MYENSYIIQKVLLYLMFRNICNVIKIQCQMFNSTSTVFVTVLLNMTKTNYLTVTNTLLQL